MDINWQCVSFDELSTRQLYEIIKLRVDVFVVEQNCPYEELDNKDHQSGVKHLLGYLNDELVAYSRLLPAGISLQHLSIGRVITKQSARGSGLGNQLLEQAINHCNQYWPNQIIEIEAQAHLQKYYEHHGFVKHSEPFMLDGIPHIEMQRAN
ncbi:GNAT family N-acetyltransferase [Vibrio sp. CAIM 722]|uniref:Protein ElaA n=1 Tax=Vibrio eleionomae TaxID=2653505 RepID=A0A7X4RTM3_9VIBR|nr:GNAT family N-acetyltransferase [Vibrio eleionomae]MZI92362.1 GNAT family N-acetyltransferase [Vibrio eleionomae]